MRVFYAIGAAIVGFSGLVIGVLDLTGILTTDWVVAHIPGITLLIVGSLATFVGLTYERRINQISDEIKALKEATFEAISGPRVVVFKTPLQYWQYCEAKIGVAESMSDLTWGISPARWRTTAEKKAFDAYRAQINRQCRERQMRVREVFTFPVKIRVRRLLEVIDGRGTDSYSARYFDVNHVSLPPLIQLTIFGNEEVLFGPHRGDALDPAGELYLSVTDPNVVKLACDYFEAVWLKGIPLKDGVTLHTVALDRVRALAVTLPD